jgi:hypothetical protein
MSSRYQVLPGRRPQARHTLQSSFQHRIAYRRLCQKRNGSFDPSLRCFPSKDSGRPTNAPDGICVEGVYLVASTIIYFNYILVVTFIPEL